MEGGREAGVGMKGCEVRERRAWWVRGWERREGMGGQGARAGRRSYHELLLPAFGGLVRDPNRRTKSGR